MRKGECAVQETEFRRLGTGDLVRRLINNVSSLVDREAELAKQEVRQDAMQVGTGAGCPDSGRTYDLHGRGGPHSGADPGIGLRPCSPGQWP